MADDKDVVLDISSDEDVGWGDGIAAWGGVGDDGNWISELFGAVDNKEKDDSDEVVVVREVIVKPKLRVSQTLSKCVNNININDVDDDDECMILDGDPDKPVSIQNDKGGGVADDSDDLLVVSEKGQVACRDYPHARHLCVKLPFNSTSHERHCDQCHCYVCDSLAPCTHWGTGISTVDHCHATDKDEFWKAQRKHSKTLPALSAAPDTSFSVRQYQPCQTPSLPFEPSQQNVVLTRAHQISSLAISNGSNVSTYASTPLPGRYPVDKPQPRYGNHQLRNTQNKGIRSDMRHIVGNAGSQVVSHTPFKRVGRVPGVFQTNGYCSNTSQSNYHYQSSRSHPPAARWAGVPIGAAPNVNTYKGSSKTRFGSSDPNLVSKMLAQTSTGSGNVNSTPCPPQVLPRAHGSNVNRHTAGPLHQVSSQMIGVHNIINSKRTPNWNCSFNVPFPFQSQATSFPGAIVSQSPMASPSLVEKNMYSQGNATASALHSSFTDIDYSWDPVRSHSNQPLPVDYDQLQNAVQTDMAAVHLDGNSQFSGFANPYPLDFQSDSWVIENEYGLDGLDIPDLDVFPPEAAPLDAGLLFDF